MWTISRTSCWAAAICSFAVYIIILHRKEMNSLKILQTNSSTVATD